MEACKALKAAIEKHGKAAIVELLGSDVEAAKTLLATVSQSLFALNVVLDPTAYLDGERKKLALD